MPLNNGYTYVDRIASRDAGARLIDYLSGRYDHSSVETWRMRIERGEVEVDQRRPRPEQPLDQGATVAWSRPPWVEPEVPLQWNTVALDDDVWIVDKPAGLPTVPAGGYLEQTLLMQLRREDPRLVPLHRLGRWTSGLVLFARTQTALRALSRQWRDGEVDRDYVGRARGKPQQERFSVDAPIGPIPYPPLGQLHAADPAGRPARTTIRLHCLDGEESWVRARLHSGRPHQIRIHLAVAGHPLVGDPLFAPGGRPAPGCRALPGDPGYRLHALRLGFTHPRGGRRWSVVCKPADLPAARATR